MELKFMHDQFFCRVCFDIITKLPSIYRDTGNLQDTVLRNVHASLDKLGVTSIYGLLLHNPNDILTYGSPLVDALKSLRDNGLVKKIGVSIYSPSILDEVFAYFEPDIVQAPFNVIDRAILDSGWLKVLNSHGIEVHARSVFLQGLL